MGPSWHFLLWSIILVVFVAIQSTEAKEARKPRASVEDYRSVVLPAHLLSKYCTSCTRPELDSGLRDWGVVANTIAVRRTVWVLEGNPNRTLTRA